jgi:hypothetical protein
MCCFTLSIHTLRLSVGGRTHARTHGRTDGRTEIIYSIFRDKLLLLVEHGLIDHNFPVRNKMFCHFFQFGNEIIVDEFFCMGWLQMFSVCLPSNIGGSLRPLYPMTLLLITLWSSLDQSPVHILFSICPYHGSSLKRCSLLQFLVIERRQGSSTEWRWTLTNYSTFLHIILTIYGGTPYENFT